MSRYSNHYNNELIQNCEQYMSKLMKSSKRTEKPRVESRNVREKSVHRLQNPSPLARVPPKSQPAPLAKQEEPPQDPSREPQQLIHKEVFNNNMATVEVTVRTLSTRKRSRSNSAAGDKQREPWGKLLQNRKSEESIGVLANCDPLRTLHFLSKELQLKLQASCGGDPCVQQIISDIQHALHRIPPEVVTSKSTESIDQSKECSGDAEMGFRHEILSKPGTMNQMTQTNNTPDAESKRIQIQLEESATKLEYSCKQMEAACNKLRLEKDELESLLVQEKETVNILRKELDERLSEKNEKYCNELRKLKEDRDELQRKLLEAQINIESQAGVTAQEMRSVIQKLRDQQISAEKDNNTLKSELTLMRLEKDKLDVLLESRDKQLKELRSELDGIQSLVHTQLVELKTKPSEFSPASSISSVISHSLKLAIHKRPDLKEKSIQQLYIKNMGSKSNHFHDFTSIESSSSVLQDIESLDTSKPRLEFTESQSVDLSGLPVLLEPSTLTFSTTIPNLASSCSTNIRDMFAELKKQALTGLNVTLQSPPRPFPEMQSIQSKSSHSS